MNQSSLKKNNCFQCTTLEKLTENLGGIYVIHVCNEESNPWGPRWLYKIIWHCKKCSRSSQKKRNEVKKKKSLPVGYMLWSFGFFFTNSKHSVWIHMKWGVIFMKSWTWTSYLWDTTGSYGTWACRPLLVRVASVRLVWWDDGVATHRLLETDWHVLCCAVLCPVLIDSQLLGHTNVCVWTPFTNCGDSQWISEWVHNSMCLPALPPLMIPPYFMLHSTEPLWLMSSSSFPFLFFFFHWDIRPKSQRQVH